MDLTEEQWKLVSELLPEETVREDGRGRPWKEQRPILEGILWVLRTGAPWKDLPPRYGAYQTVHRRFQRWVRMGVLQKVLHGLALHLKEKGGYDFTEGFVDGTFSPAKKGVLQLAKLNGVRVARSWPLQTAKVFLSPFTWKVLRLPKSLCLKPPYRSDSSQSSLND